MFRNKKNSFIILFFLTSNCIAQDTKEIDVTDVFKVTIMNPGIGYEKRIGKNQTIYTQGFMNLSALVSGDFYGTTEYQFYFDPALTGQYRYYYNLKKRADNDKRIDMNSGNYVAAVYETVFSKAPISTDYMEETKRRAMNRIGVVWGLQRNFEKRFSLDLNVGLGYLSAKSTRYDVSQDKTISKTTGLPTLLGQINIGFWLNKR